LQHRVLENVKRQVHQQTLFHYHQLRLLTAFDRATTIVDGKSCALRSRVRVMMMIWDVVVDRKKYKLSWVYLRILW
jgi:hypothetical protein